MKASYLLLLLLIAFSTSYKYEYIPSESFEEEEPNLSLNILGLIGGWIKSRINTLKDPQFWISKIKEKLGNEIKKQFLKLAENNNPHIHTIFDDIIRCDERENKKNLEQVIAIREEVGLPLNIREFCQGNPDCGTKIRSDYDYLDYVIFKIPMPKNIPPGFIKKGNILVRTTPRILIPRPPRFLSEDPRNDPKYIEAKAKIDKMQKILRQMDEILNRCIVNPASFSDLSPKERIQIIKNRMKSMRPR